MRTKKICGKCKVGKHLSEFGKKSSTNDGKQPYCRKCNQLYLNEWYKNNKLTHRAETRRRKKDYREKATEFVVNYLLTHPCLGCGENDPIVLEFNHVDPKTKSFCVSKIMTSVTSIDFKTLKNEMDKCEILCANCHRRKTAKDRNYFRYTFCVGKQLIKY